MSRDDGQAAYAAGCVWSYDTVRNGCLGEGMWDLEILLGGIRLVLVGLREPPLLSREGSIWEE